MRQPGSLELPPSIAAVLWDRARRHPDAVAYVQLASGERQRLTYGELDRSARVIAARLLREMRPGDRVLLLYRSPLRFLECFWACLYAGVVAVPAYPPRSRRLVGRILAIATNARPTAILTESDLLKKIKTFRDGTDIDGFPLVATDLVDFDPTLRTDRPQAVPETIAFLQYTSGSTSSPKGVQVTHGNLLNNHEMLRQGMAQDENSVFVSWLPLFHDMGLIGVALQAIYLGRHCVLMTPESFIQDPLSWLEAISRYGGTVSGAPNFAYEYCVRKFDRARSRQLDLSTWRVAFNGAEPVQAETLEQFQATFAPFGLRDQTLYPCYGLAENTLFATGGSVEVPPMVSRVDPQVLETGVVAPPEGDGAGRDLVGCGRPWMDQRVVVVETASYTACRENRVGEIWLAGPCLARGYWECSEETKKTFRAQLLEPLKDGFVGPFLRTGDLGFLRDGELYVTGRRKDLIIIEGRNLYPQDLELTAERAHAALRPGCCAAFPIEIDGRERLGLVQEVHRQHRRGNFSEMVRAVRQALSAEHEIEAHAVVLIRHGSLPKTSSGKIQRRATRAAYLAGELRQLYAWQATDSRTTANTSFAAVPQRQLSKQELVAWLGNRVGQRLGQVADAVDLRAPLTTQGLSSRSLVELSGELQEWLGRSVPPTLFYDHPSIIALAEYLSGSTETPPRTVARERRGAVAEEGEPIAVIGMACRFPGAANPEALWRLLRGGVDAIEEVPPERWNMAENYHPDPDRPGKMNTRWGGFLARVDGFDAAHFGISPREARRMDPQQRILLEVAWETLEDACLSPDRLQGSTAGVFVGISGSDYGRLQMAEQQRFDGYYGTGNALSIAANRLSYVLDWRGPSLAIDTACSSSLVAVHQAVRSLRTGECPVALACGVNLVLTPDLTIDLSRARMMAADGRCKTFDAAADGYVRGEGCGVLALKPLAAALDSGDRILSVIRGSSVGQDGRSNGLTAPSGMAQQEVVRRALADAEVSDSQLGYVEAHGIGTPLGDPIEVQALASVLATEGREPCYVGSLKANIGHLEAASGIAGLIKVILILQHGEIPPQIHLRNLNPMIPDLGSRLRIATELRNWARGEAARIAGVSSFGFGGTNAHVVVSEAPEPAPSSALVSDREYHILTLSASSPAALQRLAQRYCERLESEPGLSLIDLTYSANIGRRHLPQRLALVAATSQELLHRLKAVAAGEAEGEARGVAAPDGMRPQVAFLFTASQRSWYPKSIWGLAHVQPVFRTALERCEELFAPRLGPSLQEIFDAASGTAMETAPTRPILFTLSYALCALWRSWGVEADVVLGHDAGLRAAACAAGTLSFEGAVEWVLEGDGVVEANWEERLAERVRNLPGEGVEILLEIGPHAERLSQHSVDLPGDGFCWLTSFERGREGEEVILGSLAELYIRGIEIDWEAFDAPFERRKVSLPTYPFEHRRYWVGETPTTPLAEIAPAEAALGISGDSRQGAAAVATTVSPPAVETAEMLRRRRTVADLRDIVGRVLEIDPTTVDIRLPFLEMGADSLAIMEVLRAVEERYGVAPQVQQLFSELVHIAAVADYLDNALPAEQDSDASLSAAKEAEPLPVEVVPELSSDPGTVGVAFERLIAEQNRTMERVFGQQLLEMRRLASSGAAQAVSTSTVAASPPAAIEQSRRHSDLLARASIRSGEEVVSPTASEAVAASGKVVAADRDRPEAVPIAEVAFPLGLAQRQLLALATLDPEAVAAYHVPLPLRLVGDLRVDLLAAALKEVVARHEALRTTFDPSTESQIVHSLVSIKLPLVDLSTGAAKSLEPALRDTIDTPFDLVNGPLFRCSLFRVSEREHVLLLVVPHLVIDGWSMRILIGELAQLYASAQRGESNELAPARPYRKYVDWQSRALSGREMAGHESFWIAKLGGELPVLELPTDFPRPSVKTYRGGSCSCVFNAGCTAALRKLGQRSNATASMVLAATFFALLHRLTGQRVVVAGVPVLGRPAEAMGVVGYCAHLLPVTSRLESNSTFRQLLARVRDDQAAALDHQDYPFARLLERLALRRDPSRSPLVSVTFNMVPRMNVSFAELEIEMLSLPTAYARFELEVDVVPVNDGLILALAYNTDLFLPSTARRWLLQLRELLAAFVANPERRVLELLHGAEHHQLLVEWNDTRTLPPQALTLDVLFEAQACATPDTIAVAFEAQQLTYRELLSQADGWACSLLRLGVASEVIVALAISDPLRRLVAVLAVLRAGGAYLALDPALPPRRQAFLLEDAGAELVLSDGALPDGVAFAGEVVRCDRGRPAPGRGDLPPPVRHPDQLAYLIYTSGSTGLPKGVLVPHRGAVAFLASMAHRPGFTAAESLLAVTTLSFDISLLELFLPLSCGGRVGLVSQQTAADGWALQQQLTNSRAAVMQATPATWNLLLETGWRPPRGMRILAGGEALSEELASALCCDGVELWNLYGPTETTVWSAVERVDPAGVTIGRAISNTRLYVLDRHLRPVSIGALGELAIGGIGVTRGYWRRPSRTAERFFPDPLAEELGGRLYRTGDLVRYLPDGRLVFLGRMDHQIKLRGFRIEVGEIEAALSAQPEIGECAVVLEDDPATGHRLVAYLVPGPGEQLRRGGLRAALRTELPSYMVPAAFVELEALPRLLNGKLDRTRLTAVGGRSDRDASHVPPNSAAEQVIAEAWGEVLGLADEVGREDNFFDLGGHSLLAAQVIRRLVSSPVIERTPTMIDFFRYPQVRALARFLAPSLDSPSVPRRRSAVRPRRNRDEDTSVAVVGLALRVPGADNEEELWRNLTAGREAIRTYSEAELLASGVAPAQLADPRFVAAGADIPDVDLFDARFFGYGRREAELMDPQHRIFLECCWQAVENAGYDPRLYPAPVGVFAGVGLNTYLGGASLRKLRWTERYQVFLGNDKDFVPTRVSYKLNLRGPSINVQTACSSSLVAVHMACRSLREGECDMALCGGVSINFLQRSGYLYEREGILSPDGHCRAFAADARGTVFGDGAGVVVLKRLTEALAAGDRVRAVIRGSAVNNDGGLKAGYTAPSQEGQREVIEAALAAAGLEPQSLSYIECHGTGTELGDAIEIAALQEVLTGCASGSCVIGSTKSNLGHLDTAAGVAGLIKTVLALENRLLPPSLHCERQNPQLEIADSPLVVQTERRAWTAGNGPLRAGVSSFGIGGTNAHVVLEEAPPPPASQPAARPFQLLVLSARSPTALEAATDRLVAHLECYPDLDLADLAFTSQIGRHPFEHRRTLVCRSVGEATKALADRDARRLVGGEVRLGADRSVVFMFPGQGAQYLGMGRDLYSHEPAFRAALDRCAEILRPRLGLDLTRALYDDETPSDQLARTRLAQPALFAVSYASAQLWGQWGIRPAAMVGHSVGEYVAACLAGVMGLEDALGVVAERGRLMEDLPGGAMLALALGHSEVEALLAYRQWGVLSLAAINGPEASVVSGPREAIAQLEAYLEGRGVRHRLLQTSHAFHSPMMEAAVEPLIQCLAGMHLRPPEIPFLSCVSGTWISDSEATEPAYWGRQLRSPVRFSEMIGELLAEPSRVFLEVGPGRTLSILVKQLERLRPVAASLPHPADSTSAVATGLAALGKLWACGVEIDWWRLHDDQRRRVTLPTYPFERQRYWLQGAGAPMFAVGGDESLVTAATVLPNAARMPAAAEAANVGVATHEAVLSSLVELLAGLMSTDPDELDVNGALTEMGADSLVMIDALQAIEERFGVALSLRQIFEETSTLAALAGHIVRNAPAAAVSARSALHDESARLSEQLANNRIEIERLRSKAGQRTMAENSGSVSGGWEGGAVAAPHGPFQPPLVSDHDDLNKRQQRHLEKLVERLNRRCGSSKHHTQRYRRWLADNRASAGFRFSVKEMLYPLVGTRSQGSRIWDLDGNEYIDLAMGFGVDLFGHSPAFIMESIRAQTAEGIQLGSQSELAGEVAQRMSELTNLERVTFCNSGTEAVMTALRVARAVTGRKRIVAFEGSYHGHFDGTLARRPARGKQGGSTPMVSGIPSAFVEDVVMLDYGAEASLATIADQASELAAVLVEPVQSRRPDRQPRDFLHHVRELTSNSGTALIFDEMITGFRCHPGGAQALFDVRADLATYGKVLGGGMPIGALAGTAAYMGAIDGGVWRYGDASFPAAETTFFAGTFCKHPLAMAAARAVLQHLQHQGPALQEQLNARTADLAFRLDRFFAAEDVPIRIVHFSSLFRFAFERNLDLLFYHLLEKGIYTWEGRNCFLSTAHSDADLERIVQAVQESVSELREGGFLPRHHAELAVAKYAGTARWSNASPAPPPLEVPLTAAQEQLWSLVAIDEKASVAYNESLVFDLVGKLEPAVLRASLGLVCARHAALRSTVGEEGEAIYVNAPLRVDLPLLDLTAASGGSNLEKVANACERAIMAMPFDLVRGPLFRLVLLRIAVRRVRLIFVMHHLVTDSWSMALVLDELSEIYTALLRKERPRLAAVAGVGDLARWQQQALADGGMEAERRYWIEFLAPPLSPLELPLDRPRPGVRSFRAGLETARLDAASVAELRQLSGVQGATLAMSLQTVFALLLHRITGQRDLVIGTPVLGRPEPDLKRSVDYCTHLLAIRSRLTSAPSFVGHLRSLRRQLLESYGHQRYPFAVLLRQLELPRDTSRSPLVDAVVNIEPRSPVPLFGVEVENRSPQLTRTKWDLFLNLTLEGDEIRIDLEYAADLLDAATARLWLRDFVRLTQEILVDPRRPVMVLPIAPHRTLTEGEAAVATGLPLSDVPIKAEAESRAPRQGIEELIAGVWTEVLGGRGVGLDDDFFDLGGHSLLATRVIARLRKIFNIDLLPQDLFDAPTVAALATRVRESEAAEKPVPPIASGVRPRVVPLSFLQEWQWSVEQVAPGANNLLELMRLRGRLDLNALNHSLAEIVRRHEAVRTHFTIVDGKLAQAPVHELVMTLPLIDLERLDEPLQAGEIRRFFSAEAARPFDLARPPILRSWVLRLNPEEHVLTLLTHHILFDAWSWGVLYRELTSFYLAFCEGSSPSLPELPIHYADFALWQRRWVSGEVLRGELTYWRDKLERAPALLEHIADGQGNDRQGGTRLEIHLAREVSAGLQALGRGEGATTFMVLLALFGVVLHHMSGLSEFAVGTYSAGRHRLETEGLIGFFASLIPIRIGLRMDPDFREVLARVRAESLEGFVHQDLPFETVVRELSPEVDLRHLSQVMFTFGDPELTLDLSGLEVEPYALAADGDSVAFDLSLHLMESEGSLVGSIGCRNRLHPETIERLAEQLQRVAAWVVAQPDLPLSVIASRLAEAEEERWATAANNVEEASISKLKRIRRRAATAREK